MHIAEVVTIAKSLPLLRLNTYKSLILSYSADYRRIFSKNILVRVIFSYFLVQSFEVIHQVIKWYRLTINHVQLHILIIGLPLFNNRSRWNYIERRRIKCVIVETTQTYECAAMFHYLTVKLCIIDGTPGD